MPSIFRIKRRAVGGAAGAPASLAAAELAYNEQDDKLYYGKGNNGSGQAVSIVVVGGPGAATGGGNVSNTGTPAAGQVAEFTNPTTIQGVSTYAKLASPVFTGDPQAPTPPTSDNDVSIATTAFVKAALAAMWSTGDAKLTLKTVADPDWVLMNDGTIGSAASGSSTRANADCQPLFNLLFANISDANAPILTSAGGATTRAAQGSAAAAWTANCRMTLTRQLGRHLIIGGAGAGLTSRALGSFFGAETHTQTLAEIFSHGHGVTDPTHMHPISGATYICVTNAGTAGFDMAGASTMYLTNNYGSMSYVGTGVSIQAQGSSSPMDINNPSAVWNIMVKL